MKEEVSLDWGKIFWRFVGLSILTFVVTGVITGLVTFFSTGGMAEIARRKLEVGGGLPMFGVWIGIIFGSIFNGGLFGFVCWGFMLIPLAALALFWDPIAQLVKDLLKIFGDLLINLWPFGKKKTS